jgi:hypothetical protein
MGTQNTYELGAGFTVTTKLEANSSTTITINNSSLGYSYTWNSGTYIACKLISTGVATTVVILSEGNTRLGLLTDKLVGWGCKSLVESVNTGGSGGGGGETPPEGDPGGSGGPNPGGTPPKTGEVIVIPSMVTPDPFIKPADLSLHLSPLDHEPISLVGIADPLF